MSQSKKQFLIVGNWKMHKTLAEVDDFYQKFSLFLKQQKFSQSQIGFVVPYLFLHHLINKFKGAPVFIGSQDFYPAAQGAFTGAINIEMLASIGVKHTLVGHSERRQLFQDTDEWVNHKMKNAFANQITPILCVGESLQVFRAQATRFFIYQQLTMAFADIKPPTDQPLIIAYEPIWAIGTGETATPKIVASICAHIRHCLQEIFDAQVAEEAVIMYGGSVKPDNARELADLPNVDGLLVGGASLQPETFAKLIQALEN